MTEPKVVLITGASSGIGKATASLLARRGYRVFGASRNPQNIGDDAGIDLLTLDVCSEDSAGTCIKGVLAQTGRLDILINGAGFVQKSAIEEVSLAEARAQFETNFFGLVRMTKAVLPLMREQRSGQIINISSLAGEISLPFYAFYASSKFAVEGFTEALRHEVRPFGIRVSLVEPGFINTALWTNERTAAKRIEAYDRWRDKMFAYARRGEDAGEKPELVAGAILRIIESRSPKLRNQVGRQAQIFSLLNRFVPESIREPIARHQFGLD